MTEISKVYHANVYVDGTTSLLGQLSEVKLPDIALATSEHKGLGMFGTVELPSGIGALVMALKWSGFYADAKKLGANPFKSRRIQIRANHETYDEGGRIAEVALVITVAGSWKKAGGDTFKGQEASDTDDEVTCTYLKCELDGVELYEIDVINNIYKVDGEDLLENMRKNLGES